MSPYIQAEAELAASGFLLGLALMISYDFLRLFRLLIPHGNFWMGIEDFLYWLYSAFMTFSLILSKNNGILRAYIIVCVFLGMALYDRIVSRNVFSLLKKAGAWIRIKISRLRKRRKEGEHGHKPQP